MSEHGVPDSKIKVIKQTEDYIKKNGQQLLTKCKQSKLHLDKSKLLWYNT